MNKEYVLWGIAPDHKTEDILSTFKTLKEAKDIMSLLTDKYNCTELRIQTIDFQSDLAEDFKNLVA